MNFSPSPNRSNDRVATKSGNLGKIRECFSIREIQGKKKDILKNQGESGKL